MLRLIVEVPLAHRPSLISVHNRTFVWMEGCTVDWSIIFVLFYHTLHLHIENPESSIFTGCVNEFVFFAKTSDCVNVSFESVLKGSDGCCGLGDVEYFD